MVCLSRGKICSKGWVKIYLSLGKFNSSGRDASTIDDKVGRSLLLQANSVYSGSRSLMAKDVNMTMSCFTSCWVAG